ncbi:MAG: 30S ribosome-binding factor RbfA [Sphingobacteriales bacterium]|jgi:ribosome-binding factor A|nr:MAG: 30S ribosome-binding factor RbfA [Sphingobacteriales bacterium]
MAREFKRADRVADAVQRSLAKAIPNEVRDPRLGMVNINAVVVAKDLTMAKVYFTLVGEQDAARAKQAVEILNKVASFLRGIVCKDVALRISPRLFFYYDESSVRGQALSQLIDKAVASDKAHQNTDSSSGEE